MSEPHVYICWDMVSERMTFGNHEPISEEEHADLLKALIEAAVAKGFTFGGGSRRATEAEMDEST